MSAAHKPVELHVRNHDNAFLSLPGDELGPLGSGSSKHFAKSRFGRLNLPQWSGSP